MKLGSTTKPGIQSSIYGAMQLVLCQITGIFLTAGSLSNQDLLLQSNPQIAYQSEDWLRSLSISIFDRRCFEVFLLFIRPSALEYQIFNHLAIVVRRIFRSGSLLDMGSFIHLG